MELVIAGIPKAFNITAWLEVEQNEYANRATDHTERQTIPEAIPKACK